MNDIILSDMRLPEGDAGILLEWMGREELRYTVVIMTHFSEATFAVKMMRLGARTFIAKDGAFDENLLKALKEIKKGQRMKSIGDIPMFKRKSEAYQKVMSEARGIANIGMNVLLVGESGTGKEHIAALIHNGSIRADMPFEKLDSNDVDGSFGKANGGTLFIDGIDDMQAETQRELLRILKAGTYRHGGDNGRAVDVRLISTTAERLDKAVEEGRINRGLLNMIAEYVIEIPPLRETPEDIFPLAEMFLSMAKEDCGCNVKRFNAAARKALQSHPWNGNITELRNVVYSAAVRCNGEVVTETDIVFLSSNTQKEGSVCLRKGTIDERMVRMAYEQARGNKTKAASILGISRGTFNKMLNKLWDSQ